MCIRDSSVRAEMPNPNKVLLPGQFTKVKLLLDVREGAVAVPQKAVTIAKGGAYIFVMRRDSTVEKRFIELGPESVSYTHLDVYKRQDEVQEADNFFIAYGNVTGSFVSHKMCIRDRGMMATRNPSASRMRPMTAAPKEG